jgi:preprotein translocase subunit SecD
MRLTDKGTEIMREWSGRNIGNFAVMTLDGEVLSAPILMSSLSSMVMVTAGHDDETGWIETFEQALEKAGAKRVERFSDHHAAQEIPGFQVYVASTERSDTYSGGFPLLEHTMLWIDMQPLLEQKHIASIERTSDSQGNPALGITLTEEGESVMHERVEEYIDRYFVMTWQGRAIAAPWVPSRLGTKFMVPDTRLDPDLPANWLEQLQDSLGDD